MTPDPRIESIRRAFEEARFDERTPDEKGFAHVFETELKPKLIEGIGFNLAVNDARKRRRKIGTIFMIFVAVAFFPTLVLLYAPKRDLPEPVLYVVIGVAIAVWSWVFKKRPNDEDPNHALAIDAVLGRFGCRIGRGKSPHHPTYDKGPVFPAHTKIAIQSEHVLGTFDGHMDFSAVRVVAKKKEGKRTWETFRGWYLRIELPFTFSGTTVIRERRVLANMRPASRPEGLKDVGLEDPAFGKRFGVVATDQVEARVILPPDVIHHLAEAKTDPLFSPLSFSGLTLAFDFKYAYLWLPSRATALSDWQPLNPARLIEDLHEAFAEMSEIRAFLRDIDVIAESEGFRAQAARNARAS